MERGELPEFARRSDGSKSPFEPERITRSLFAAGEMIGRADAFLARELTEGVLHFLIADPPGPVASTETIADVVAKVVRELGHPELARAYESRHVAGMNASSSRLAASSPWPAWARVGGMPAQQVRAAAAESLAAFSRGRVFPSELVSAHAENLIELTGLDTPFELAGMTVAIPPQSACEAVVKARAIAGQFLAIDGPEFDLAATMGDVAQETRRFVNALRIAAEATGLYLILNLNSQQPPPRLREGAGPLFGDRLPDNDERRREFADRLATGAGDAGLTVWWHVADADMDSACLGPRIDVALGGGAIEFVFDRPGAAVMLGPGLDRQAPVTLLHVGVNLPRLGELMGGGVVDADQYLRKVASLARFAKTAGHVKQDFLRRHGGAELREGFLLDRARLVVFPIGLAEASRATSRPPVEFAREILKTLRRSIEEDRPRRMPIRIDAAIARPAWDAVGEPGVSLAQQVRSASSLHAATAGGCLKLRPSAGGFNAAEAIATVQQAGRSAISRLRF